MSRFEAHQGIVRLYLYLLSPEGATVFEIDAVLRRDLHEVVTYAASFDIQLEVQDVDSDGLAFLDGDLPEALGIHVVFDRVVGARDVAMLVVDRAGRTVAGLVEQSHCKRDTKLPLAIKAIVRVYMG